MDKNHLENSYCNLTYSYFLLQEWYKNQQNKEKAIALEENIKHFFAIYGQTESKVKQLELKISSIYNDFAAQPDPDNPEYDEPCYTDKREKAEKNYQELDKEIKELKKEIDVLNGRS